MSSAKNASKENPPFSKCDGLENARSEISFPRRDAELGSVSLSLSLRQTFISAIATSRRAWYDRMLSYHACGTVGDAVRTNFAMSRSPRRTVVTPWRRAFRLHEQQRVRRQPRARTEPSARSQRVCEVRRVLQRQYDFQLGLLIQDLVLVPAHARADGIPPQLDREIRRLQPIVPTDSSQALDGLGPRQGHTYGIARLEEAAESPDGDTFGVSGFNSLCRLADR